MEITVPEAARRVGRNPETIRRWIWSGRLPSRKVGNQHLVQESDVDAAARAPAFSWEEWLASVHDLQAQVGDDDRRRVREAILDVLDEVRGGR